MLSNFLRNHCISLESIIIDEFQFGDKMGEDLCINKKVYVVIKL